MSTREDRESDAREDARWAALDARDEALTCESCDGEGVTDVESNDGSGEYESCPECDGTGRIDPDAFEDPYWEPRT